MNIWFQGLSATSFVLIQPSDSLDFVVLAQASTRCDHVLCRHAKLGLKRRWGAAGELDTHMYICVCVYVYIYIKTGSKPQLVGFNMYLHVFGM